MGFLFIAQNLDDLMGNVGPQKLDSPSTGKCAIPSRGGFLSVFSPTPSPTEENLVIQNRMATLSRDSQWADARSDETHHP